MDMDHYQDVTAETAIYPGQGKLEGLMYCALGLGEVGEVQGKVKKILRDQGGKVTEINRALITAELGDVLWYLARLADELGVNLSDIAKSNLNKLNDRKARGKLQGNGDAR